MATFYDNFHRANGALGGNWVVVDQTFTISGNIAIPGTYGEAVNTTVGDADYLYVKGTFGNGGVNAGISGVGVKASSGSADCYFARRWWITDRYYLQILRGTVHSGTTLVSVDSGAELPFTWTMELTYDHGHLTAVWNGTVTAEADDLVLAANTYCAMGGWDSSTRVLDFTAVGEMTAALTVDPEVIGNYGSCTTLTLTGTGTAWTTGTPGSPIFTVDHGEITAQEITSETTATITYCPGNYLGAIIFTDPSTGMTATAIVTSDPAIVPPSDLCPFDDDFVATANATVRADNRGFPTLQTIIMPGELGWGDLYLLEAIRDIWYTHFRPDAIAYGGNTGLLSDVYARLWGGEEWQGVSFVPAGSNSLMDWLAQVYTIVNTMSQGNTLTLQSILDALDGGPVDLTPILDAIGTSWFDPDYTLHDDLDYLDNRSDHSLDQIQTRLGNMWGTDHWSLSQIVGAATDPQIESFASLHNIYARLQAMRGDTESTIANAEDWANLANTNASGAHSAIDAWRTGSNYTAQDILDRLDSLTAQIAAASYQGAPVWPGVAGATVYAPYNLTDGLTVQGPLHGLLFTITGQPAGAGRYRFGTHNSWTKCGAAIFTSDRGDHERAQQFGLDAHVVCPKEMRSAASATLRLNTGWTGTVRRFLID